MYKLEVNFMKTFELSVTGVRDIWKSIDYCYVYYVRERNEEEKFNAFLAMYQERLLERHPRVNMRDFTLYLDDPFENAMKQGSLNFKNDWVHPYRNIAMIKDKLPEFLYLLFITYEKLLSDYGLIIL